MVALMNRAQILKNSKDYSIISTDTSILGVVKRRFCEFFIIKFALFQVLREFITSGRRIFYTKVAHESICKY